jgi:predicted alpha-1,2-mannosidase
LYFARAAKTRILVSQRFSSAGEMGGFASLSQWIIVCLFAVSQAQAQRGGSNLTRYVNPFIGTGQGAPDFDMGSAAGNTPPGAAYPFGMVLWSPDTTSLSGGYRYEHNTIRGFSLTHFSGRGISCWQDLPIMPVAGLVKSSRGSDWGAYASGFSHAAERAEPGFYSVALENGVSAELTVSRRTGLGRFTFPETNRGTILVHTGGSANGNWGATWIKASGDAQLYGAVTSGNCGGVFSYTVYFVMQFDRPFADKGGWKGDATYPGVNEAAGDRSGMYVTFDTSANRAVRAKIGLSFVGFTNAYANLSAETPGWDFEAARQRASEAWNDRLASIRVSGAADRRAEWEDRRVVFYTALYHASIHPSTFNDVNGEYLGFDGKIHYTSRTQYHNIPSWDFYRSLVPLLSITAPDVASDLAQSLVNDAQQDPSGGMPRWVHAATDSCGMFGDSSPKVVATTYAFGARGFDTSAALAAMVRGATQPGTTAAGCPVREGLEDYLSLGYVSTNTWGSAARTLEYANGDFAISQFAQALGDSATYKSFLRRAQSWRNLLQNGNIVPRSRDGRFIPGFSLDGCVSDGFVEGSGGQYGFMVRFNGRGLFDAIGGSAAAIARLDRHFQRLNAGPCSEFAYMGNEVSLKTPWMYAFAGAPWKTQEVVRRILSELYTNTPGGMPGNDDGGVLSSWVVFSSLGLYPQISGVGGLVVGSPVFPHAEIRLANGRMIRIDAPAADPRNRYVQSLSVNGQEYRSPWIPWKLLGDGGELVFAMGGVASQTWGAQGDVAPPSFDVQVP